LFNKLLLDIDSLVMMTINTLKSFFKLNEFDKMVQFLNEKINGVSNFY